MCYAGRLDRSYAFQLDRFGAKTVKQPDATAKQDRRYVNIHFVNQSRLEALL